jgi:hypothetical protein
MAVFRLHEGWEYTIYKYYVFGGLAALMGTPILTTLVFGDTIAYENYGIAYAAMLTLWVVGILAYWWWSFLWKGIDDPLPADGEPTAVPRIRSLKNLTTLHRAMVIYGGNREAFQAAERAAMRPVLEFYAWLNLLVLWIFVVFWTSLLGIFPPRLLYLLPVGVVAIAIGLMIRIYLLSGSSAERFAESYLPPLGLRLADNPSLTLRPFAMLTGGQTVMPKGTAVLTGTRHGHLVRIETADQVSVTHIQVPVPVFTIRDEVGKLKLEGEPLETVAKAIKSLRKAKRWRGIKVTGGPEGIKIERKSRQQNMWLYDLWLAEYLLVNQDVV